MKEPLVGAPARFIARAPPGAQGAFERGAVRGTLHRAGELVPAAETP